ncbi:MAG: PHP domain-containing protein [Spirochaetota bacterium]
MIDLHTHSTASDGALEPADLVELAARGGLEALALTDHDTVAGCPAAAAATRALRPGRETAPMRFVPGIELEVAYPRFGTCHMVGLDIDIECPELLELVAEAQEERLNRNMVLISRLQSSGIPIESRELPGGPARAGRLHFAQELIRRGIVSSVEEAFARFLGPAAATYAARTAPSVARCLRSIQAAGGVPVVAHPSTLHLSWSRLEEQLRDWRHMGLEGIEVYFPGAFRRTTMKLIALADRLDLACSGGSDFHDARRSPGYVFGREIPSSLLSVLDRKAR